MSQTMPNHAKSISPALSAVRSSVGKRGASSRWGSPRPASRTIRVNADAYAALLRVPERDRREVASSAILAACAGRGN